MRLEELKEGKRIEYKFRETVETPTEDEGTVIEQVITRFATSPVYFTKREWNTKLQELVSDEDKEVIEIVVVNVQVWTKPEDPTKQ